MKRPRNATNVRGLDRQRSTRVASDRKVTQAMAKQLRIEATVDEPIDPIDEAAEACREVDERYEKVKTERQKAYATLLSRMLENKKARYESSKETGTGILVKVKLPDPTVSIQVLDMNDDDVQ